MLVGLNIVVILLTVFIAYWWANQGLFSSLLHLVCVIIAGAIALAFWEPLATVLLTGGGFDNYAWGVSLVGLFAVSLLILRVAMDRLAPNNVSVPHWASLSFGGVLGMGSGILTMGILAIGCGFIQSTHPIAGYRGDGRSASGREVKQVNAMWLPVNKLTSSFYEWLSVTSLSTSRPLRQYSPDLAAQANLVRDSYKDGRGQVSLADDAARVVALYFCAEDNRYGVLVHFDNIARDFGEQLTISSAQVRLIEQPRTKTAAARTVHPDRWTQYSGTHLFDDRSHYITTETGQQGGDAVIEFKTATDFVPRFIQIKNLRLALTARQDVPCLALRSLSGSAQAPTDLNFQAAGSIAPHIRVDDLLRPITMGKNTMPAGLEEINGALTQGKGAVQRGADRVGRQLAINTFYAPKGSSVIKLDISRRTAADLTPYVEKEGENGSIALIDSTGNEYAPYGYILDRDQEYEIELQPSRLLSQYKDIPKLPSAGNQKLTLLFHVTDGVTIIGLRYGKTAVGGCNLLVPVKGD